MSRVMIVKEHGGPDVLTEDQWDIGEPGPGQVRIRHTAIGLNFVDTYQRSGLYPMSRPFVGGNEGAGVVVAVGPGVTEVSVGDRVCYQGVPGAYADERLIAAEKLVPIPGEIDDRIAAAVLLKGLTAYYLLFETWKVGPRQTILWHAAAGGTGRIATQWAKALGASVIGTAGGPDKAALAKAGGCDHVVDYASGPFAPTVRELTAGQGVDVVYDGVGRATFEGSLDSLRPRGLLVSFGNASGPVAIPDLGILARKGSLFVTRPTGAHYFARRSELLAGAERLFAAVISREIVLDPPKTYALADVAAAHRALEARQTTGSVVLLP